MQDNIFFAGASNCIAEVLEKIDILFVCSQNEAFGRTTVEGMMAGCLIVGADTAGTKELLEGGENGYLYRCGDVENLANTIEYVLKNREKAKQIRRIGQKKAVRKYTAVKNADKVFLLYQRFSGNEKG